jgi:hypothetical protein
MIVAMSADLGRTEIRYSPSSRIVTDSGSLSIDLRRRYELTVSSTIGCHGTVAVKSGLDVTTA